RLLRGQRRPAQDCDAVRTVPLLDLAEAACRQIERLVPSRDSEPFCIVAQQGVEETIGVAALHVPLHALGTEHAAVEGKLLPRLEADDAVVAHLELDAALLAGEA